MTPQRDGTPGALYEPGLLANEVDAATVRGPVAPRPSPELALVAAIVKNALDESRGFVSPSSTSAPLKRVIEADARAWLADVTSPNGFGGATWGLAFCCEALGCSPEELAAKVTTLASTEELRRARERGRLQRRVGAEWKKRRRAA